jgi:hypothetical protein
MAGNPMAGNRLVGNLTAGNPTAGNLMAGSPTFGPGNGAASTRRGSLPRSPSWHWLEPLAFGPPPEC